MKKLINKIRLAIRRWLGLEEIFMGVDMGYRDESCIVIMSRQNNGIVKIIDARFGSQIEVERFVKECQARYGIPQKNTFWDVPYGTRRRSF